MNKLEERFEDIISSANTEAPMNGLMSVRISRLKEYCAKEAKELAIEFAEWKDNHFLKIPFKEEYVRITNNADDWPLNFNKVNIRALFNKFIEEKYAR